MSKKKEMIPAGYMLKRIAKKPDWLKTNQVKEIYSLSACTSGDFDDYIEYWKHNGFWLFDSPEIIHSIVTENNIDTLNTKMFYYEIYEYQCYEDGTGWERIKPSSSINVTVPSHKELKGFDIVSFYCLAAPECSYLSCNHMAEELKVNQYCLFDTFNEAKKLLEEATFRDCEPGPCRIFAVYTISGNI